MSTPHFLAMDGTVRGQGSRGGARPNRWRSLVSQALRAHRGRNDVKDEWKNMSADQLEMLRAIQMGADMEPFFSMTAKGQTTLNLMEEEAFVLECLETSLLDSGWESGSSQLPSSFEGIISFTEARLDLDISKLLHKLMFKAVELRNKDLLEDLLEFSFMKPASGGCVRAQIHLNEPALVKACELNHFDLVMPLVRRGYRLQTGHLSKQTEEELNSWQRYTELPIIRQRMENFLGNKDEISDLHLLKVIAQPAYIIASYMVIHEKTDWAANTSCQCHNFTKKKDKSIKTVKGKRELP